MCLSTHQDRLHGICVDVALPVCKAQVSALFCFPIAREVVVWIAPTVALLSAGTVTRAGAFLIDAPDNF
jgi:hypothetical protein